MGIIGLFIEGGGIKLYFFNPSCLSGHCLSFRQGLIGGGLTFILAEVIKNMNISGSFEFEAS